MKPNIGRVNALIRITVGLTILACSTAQLTRKRKSCLSFFERDWSSDEGSGRHYPVLSSCLFAAKQIRAYD